MNDIRCESCGEVVGVYEPMRLILADGSELTGSRLTLHDELGQPDIVVLHEHCHSRHVSERHGLAWRPGGD